MSTGDAGDAGARALAAAGREQDAVWRGLADLVLAIHVGVVAFVVGGLVLVIVGNAWRHWRWVNGLVFRLAHLLAILTVAAEAWLGIACPLTTLETALRRRAQASTYDGGFIEHWLQRVLYHDLPPWVFTAGYSAFALLVLFTWWRYPPRRLSPARRARGASATGSGNGNGSGSGFRE